MCDKRIGVSTGVAKWDKDKRDKQEGLKYTIVSVESYAGLSREFRGGSTEHFVPERGIIYREHW